MFYNNIKRIAKKKKIKLHVLAEELGIHKSNISKISEGTSIKRILEICDILDCSIYEIIGSTEKYQNIYDENGVWLGIRVIPNHK